MLGAYFPYWMLCTFIGILGALIVRVLLIYWGIDDKLPLPLIFYFAILLSISLTISLFYFSY
ncbi:MULTISPECIES: YtcA family lipoprotein [Proteus]|uniref:YtcA family lipoprotein n=2 Tax=Proteus TaxID=583 RepID=UPI003075B356